MRLEEQQNLIYNLIAKAQDDESFKKELINNPKQAIKNFSGIELDIPEGKQIVVRDQTDTSKLFLNIPTNPGIDDMELNEEQLEAVSGGVGTIIDFGELTLPIIDCFPIPAGEDRPK
ncbi:NHLP leader peptide family RiPP precursor [Aquimarina brevivitae]|uniref:Putative ribosomally synthesized peptide n=1 Tax=Aquimarina brevivitae TaxID=323412 RepID=A0A4Q7PHL2_9FLAO|nr:NHLP leader peptide family RiPP precursor [Aquimarina brevivitae]RZS99438.1 putative ribosomally synthesized peptide [Aquimarina brevivitae]